jgi:secreted protein with Ig-like and vWFA domain/uracil DNA glycosylase
MNTTLHASYALTRPVLPVKSPCVVDLLLTFRTERTGDAHGPGPRLPLNLSLVIDRSGSMSGKKLKQAIAAAEVLLEQLDANDTLSVVAYDDKVATVVGPQKVTDPGAIRKEVRNIKPGGTTNLHGGWLQGCKHALQRGGERLIRRVLLLTDGQANVGITEPRQLTQVAREQADKGVLTTTLGFGNGFNEDLLIGMAEASGGNFYFIETPEDACQVFHIEGESLTSIAAQNLSITLTPAADSGVKVREVLNHYPARAVRGGLLVTIGDVYSAEDKLVAVEIEVPPQARATKNLPLLDVSFAYDPVTGGGKRTTVEQVEGQLAVTAPVGKESVPAAFDVLQQVARIRIARVKENAVALADADKDAEAAGALRALAEELRRQGLDEEFEIAEEIAQLEYFADTVEKGGFGTNDRKVLRDQSYQGRTRNRSDLSARGGAGGSADNLETTDSPAGGVELACVREGGKLRMRVVSPGYEPDFNVQFPRGVREEGVHYVVDRLETSANGTFYRAAGKIRRLTRPSKVGAALDPHADPADPLKLTELFAGGGEPWLPLLKPVLEAQPEAGTFIGPKRDQTIVPVRELTFQALKPNPPQNWKVVVFGQNPYPRVESATGIAMFDNTFGNWNDSQFGKVPTIRCIIKAAMMWKHKIPKNTPIADMRKLLAQQNTVQPPEWFQATLTQGVLLLNAALTASSDGSMSTDRHTGFWRPVVERLVEEIFKAKQSADDRHKGVVFAWWGAHAKALRKVVEKLQKQYTGVPVRHIDHCNPAAQGDIFCDGHHFADINTALRSLKMDEIDWLPAAGWNQGTGQGPGGAPGDADRMGDFIARTMELHKLYLERLQEVQEEAKATLPEVVGVMATPALSFPDALGPLVGSIAGLEHYLKRSHQYAQQNAGTAAGGLSADEIAAVYLYTTESLFHKRLNAALRDPDREKVKPFFGYLRLLLSAMPKLKGYTGSLWRGVAADLRPQYPKGTTVTWWGVSSCTAKRSVASNFIGSTGRRTLFEVIPAQAAGIRRYSAFTGEDEYLLAPGARLKVTDVKTEAGGLSTITLEELADQRLVS